MQSRIKDGLSLVVLRRIIAVDIPVGAHTDRLAIRTEGDDCRCSELALVVALRVDKCVLQDRTDRLYRNRLVERHHIVATTGEVDALAQTTCSEADDSDEDSHSVASEAHLVHGHELVVGVLHEVLREPSPEPQVHPLAVVELVFVEQTCQIDSGEEVTNNTDDPGCSEATDRTGTDNEQDDTCDQRGEVGVEDGREGIAVTLSHRFLHILTLAQLLLDTLVDKHVGIHGST